MGLPPLSDNSKYYTIDEVATWLKVSTQCVRNWCRSGLIEAHKIGKLWRISRPSLEASVAQSIAKGQQ